MKALIPALSIGRRAPRRFARGRVRSVYRRACNIELDRGELLTLLDGEAGNVPHGIRCALPEGADFRDWLQPGQAVAADGSFLRVLAPGITIDLSTAARWSCALDRCAIDPSAEPSVRALRSVRTILREQAPRGGFALLLFQDTKPSSPLDQAMQRRLTRVLPALSRADAALDCGAAAQALAQLVGLGPGLTPSGDDFIVGYLAALYSRSACEPLLPRYLGGLSAPIVRLAHATNLISRQYMLNAVAGEFSESLAQVALGLSEHDDGRLRESGARLVGVGHSSGADTLVGLLFGLRPAFVLREPVIASPVPA